MQSSSTTEQQKYSAEQLAAANPEHPIVTIDLPSHGRSDRLTLSQRTEMVLGKSVAKVANSQAEAVVNYVGDNADQYIVTGDSLGAQLIPDFASKLGLLGLTPVLCVGFEMTGIDSYSSFGSAIKQYITNEGIGHQNYHTGKDNIKLDTAYERFKHELAAAGYDDALYSRFALWQRDPLFVASMFVRPPSSSESSWTALENALNDNPGMAVALVTGGLSKLCDQSLIKPKIAKFNKTYGERLVWDLWPHDSHSMSIAEQQPRAAAYTRARIKELKGV
jgi:pimeloyl-ACP methyl ester carboxylesterase